MTEWNEKARELKNKVKTAKTKADAVEIANEAIENRAEFMISDGAFRTIVSLLFWKSLINEEILLLYAEIHSDRLNVLVEEIGN